MRNKNEKTSFNSALGAKILEDPSLAQWFFDLCIGRSPQVEVSKEILDEMEKSEFIERTDAGFKLGTAGKAFAHTLGLIQDKTPLELVPILMDYMSGRVSKIDEKKKTQDSTNLEEKRDESKP